MTDAFEPDQALDGTLEVLEESAALAELEFLRALDDAGQKELAPDADAQVRSAMTLDVFRASTRSLGISTSDEVPARSGAPRSRWLWLACGFVIAVAATWAVSSFVRPAVTSRAIAVPEDPSIVVVSLGQLVVPGGVLGIGERFHVGVWGRTLANTTCLTSSHGTVCVDAGAEVRAGPAGELDVRGGATVWSNRIETP